jgi:hypothetical protein
MKWEFHKPYFIKNQKNHSYFFLTNEGKMNCPVHGTAIEIPVRKK